MNRWRWVLWCGLCTALLTVLVLALDGRRQRIEQRTELGYRLELQRLEVLAARLDRELSCSRAGLSCSRAGLGADHQELSHAFDELRAAQQRLLQAPAGLGFVPGPELSAALVQVNALAGEQRRGLQRFETENALLHSARQSYPTLLAALDARLLATPGSEQVGTQLTTLLLALAKLDVALTPDALAGWRAALDGLQRASAAWPGAAWSAELAPVLEQGRQIAAHAPVVDELLHQLLSQPLGAAIQRALDGHRASQQEALARAQLRSALVSGFTALALILGVALVLLHLRDHEQARQRAERDLLGLQRMLDSASRSLERERRQAQQQQRLEPRFFFGISEELRSPVTNILSSSRMLTSYGESWSSQHRQEHLERISAAAVRLKEMLEELVLIGRAELGNLVATPATFDLHTFCEQQIESLTQNVAQLPLAAASLTPSPLGAVLQEAEAPRVLFSFRGERKVNLDQALLAHVLGNLLENALKYSRPASEVGLHVTVTEDGVRCVVQDAGPGISQEELPRLFQPFRRGRNAGYVPGSGLGLAVARRALQAQGGTLDVHSAPGKGSEFVVWLPLAQQPSHTVRSAGSDLQRTIELDSGEIELLPLPLPAPLSSRGELSA